MMHTVLKRRAFPSFNPSGATVRGCLMATFALGAGICLWDAAAYCVSRWSLDCRREGGVVGCELRKLYPGAIASTERFRLNSAVVEQRSSWNRGSFDWYGVLVLNSDVEVPSSRSDPHDLAARLNQLLDGKLTVTGPMQLTVPSYGHALILSVLAVLLSGSGAFRMWIAVFGERPSRPAHD